MHVLNPSKRVGESILSLSYSVFILDDEARLTAQATRLASDPWLDGFYVPGSTTY